MDRCKYTPIMRTILLTVAAFSLLCSFKPARECLIEAEQFAHLGGWTLTAQYMDQMGSPYLQAHGIGTPVEDAHTTIHLPSKGTYYIYARTYNWTSPWTDKKGAGQFQVMINGQVVGDTLGCRGNQWEWQYAGRFNATTTQIELALHDLTGFDGRCDAVFFTKVRHVDLSHTTELRKRLVPTQLVDQGQYDFVVVGGGLAGMCAAVAAARLGLKTALIHDRAVLGGNNSSEIRVHTSGQSCKDPYPNLGVMIREFGHQKVINGDNDGRKYCDSLKLKFVMEEPNVTLYLNEHVNGVHVENGRIVSVRSQNTTTGVISSFYAPLFADCTGDANLGYLAGADWEMDSLVMGASVLWNTTEEHSTFPLFEYGIQFTDESVHPIRNGEWTWETGMNRNQITEAEYIRDYGMAVAYSNWSYIKNRYGKKDDFTNRKLQWVSSVAGKRESRRLMGDYVLTRKDIEEQRVMEDATVTTTWPIDLHYPDTINSRYFPGKEFISYCVQDRIYPYPIPYRCFYSRNIANLFMAGRDISVSHAALGSVRVMRTTAMMGEVVGMAAAICKKHESLPRSIFTSYFPELQLLMQEGAGKKGVEDNQNFHLGKSRR